ncbi:MAG: hypothetical protein HY895_21385 [Deltaproteobacteria bacterium]|nr:hypothetical protein [Deltaproteobacteria bacterium]
MSERERGFIYKNCISRCRFKAKNCILKDDGKSDCSTKLENCIYLCEIDDPRKMLRGRQPQSREMAQAANRPAITFADRLHH